MKKTLTILAAILTLCGASVFTSCSDDDNNSNNLSNNSDIEKQKLEEWEPCNKLTYISGIENEDPDLQAVIKNRFPNQTKNLSNAEVAFVSFTTARANAEALDDFYERGGLVVMMRPTVEDFEAMDDLLDDDDEEDEEGYWDDELDDSMFFTDSEELDEIFLAFNKLDEYYTLYEEKIYEGYGEEEATELSDEIEAAIRAYHDEHPVETDNDTKEWLYDNDDDQNENYFQARLDPFIDFIEEIDKSIRHLSTRAASDDADNLKASPDDGFYFVKNIPISLNHIIEKDYRWTKSSSITLKYWVTPAYMYSCNGGDKAGDYYLVRSEIIPHVTPLWEVASKPGGMFNWGRCRIYAYWFDNMNVEYDLEDVSGRSLSAFGDMEFYKHPIPDVDNTEVSYSNGFSWGLNGSIEVEGKSVKPSFGFSLEWSSDRSYAIKSIQYERNTSMNQCKYRFWAPSVALKDDDYESEQVTNGNFPAITHTEFTLNTAWVWRVLEDKSIGVTDNADTHFYLRVRVKPQFASWYHWRATAQFDSNKKVYNGYHGNSEGWFEFREQLPAPSRTPFGIVALKNAASAYTVGNIKIYKQEDFEKKGLDAPVYSAIRSSFNVNEIAKSNPLPVGTYTLVYQAIDANHDNKLLGTWKCENIEIETGSSPEEATTEISTINAVEIKN